MTMGPGAAEALSTGTHTVERFGADARARGGALSRVGGGHHLAATSSTTRPRSAACSRAGSRGACARSSAPSTTPTPTLTIDSTGVRTLEISFACAPADEPRLVQAMHDEIGRLRGGGVTDDEIAIQRAQSHHRHENHLRDPSWWMSELIYAERSARDLHDTIGATGFYARLTTANLDAAAPRMLAFDGDALGLLLPSLPSDSRRRPCHVHGPCAASRCSSSPPRSRAAPRTSPRPHLHPTAPSGPVATAPTAPTAGPANPMDRDVPQDARVKVGHLKNGLTYYVLPHKKPRARAQLWLAVNAGSVLEDDDQRGLAHFVEHMAFNGTTRFPKQALVDFLETSGMRFGADLNAYTSFDETVYTLRSPPTSEARRSRRPRRPPRLGRRHHVRSRRGREGARRRARGVAPRPRRGHAPLRQAGARRSSTARSTPSASRSASPRSSRARRATRSCASTRTGTAPTSWPSSPSATSTPARDRGRGSRSEFGDLAGAGARARAARRGPGPARPRRSSRSRPIPEMTARSVAISTKMPHRPRAHVERLPARARRARSTTPCSTRGSTRSRASRTRRSLRGLAIERRSRPHRRRVHAQRAR